MKGGKQMSNQAVLQETGLDDVALRTVIDEMTEQERVLLTQNRHRVGSGATHDVSGFFF
jgi:hypothetical protein